MIFDRNIRPARADEAETLVRLVVAAGSLFRSLGMTVVAEAEPPAAAALSTAAAQGRVWVAADDQDRPIAVVMASLIDQNAHVDQVSVHPDHAGKRLGAQLIEHVHRWASGQGLPYLTLTTFVDVAWNGPYYRRLGFVAIPDGELAPGLADIRRHERDSLPDTWPRTAMRRPVGPPSSS